MWSHLFVVSFVVIIVWTSDLTLAQQWRQRQVKRWLDKMDEAWISVRDKIDKISHFNANLSMISLKAIMLEKRIKGRLARIPRKLTDHLEQRCGARKSYSSRMRKKMIYDAEGYCLVFRLTAGIRKSAYDKYTAFGHNDDVNDLLYHNVPCGCKTPNGSFPCDRHYRSVLLDLWPRLSVEKVKVSVWQKGEPKMTMLFDGRHSNCMTFFRQSRLLQDPYVDLSSSTPTQPNYFSIAGHEGSKRQFFINNNYGGCPADSGWLVVGDGPFPTPCPWDQAHIAEFPFILYADNPANSHNASHVYRRTVWQNNSGKADVLTVSIKFIEQRPCD